MLAVEEGITEERWKASYKANIIADILDVTQSKYQSIGWGEELDQ